MAGVKNEMIEVVGRILEDWAMMLVEPEDARPDVFEVDEDFYIAWLKFHGLVSGRYCVVCQTRFAQALSGNLLGMSDGAAEPEYQDALKEMVNVLSGNLLTSSYGPDTTFDLTAPEVTKIHGEAVGEMFNSFTICVRADDEPVAVTFIPEEVHGAD